MFLLDTNVLSELIKPRPDRAVSRRVLDAPAGTLFASEITRYELRYGAFLHRRPDPFWARIQAVILPIPLWLPITAAISEQTAMIAARLRRIGRGAGVIDPFIAATAQVHDLILVTRNLRHFADIEGVVTESWYSVA